MDNKFSEILSNVKKELSNLDNSKLLVDLKAKYVGKNGEVTALLRGMKDIPSEERSNFGKKVNDLKDEVTALIDAKGKELGVVFDYEAYTRALNSCGMLETEGF